MEMTRILKESKVGIIQSTVFLQSMQKNIFLVRCKIFFYPPSIFKYLQIYEIIVWLKDRHPNGYIPGNIPKTRQYHYGVGVLWVAVHPTYDPDTREYNVALLTTIWAFQFTSSMYQICLPMPDASDTNIGKKLRRT